MYGTIREPHATASTNEEALTALSHMRTELGEIAIMVVSMWMPREILRPLILDPTTPREEVEKGLKSLLAVSPTNKIAFFPIFST